MLQFCKLHGAGNDFICIDDRRPNPDFQERADWIAALCARRTGVGADGLILLRGARSPEAPLRMVYYNADGAPSSFCGNGARCFIAFAHRLGLLAPKEVANFEANDGAHTGVLYDAAGGEVGVSMSIAAQLHRVGTDVDTVDTGSPHYVQWTSVLPQGDIEAAARRIRYQEAFAKTGGINVNYVTELAANALAIRTYERGVEAETLACGTGVTAAAVSYATRTARVGRVRVEVYARGGRLAVTFERAADGALSGVRLIGPTALVFTGSVDVGQVLQSARSISQFA